MRRKLQRTRLRDECPDEHLFANLNEARQTVEKWRIDHNTNRLRKPQRAGSHHPSSQPASTVTGTRPPPRGRELGLRYSLA